MAKIPDNKPTKKRIPVAEPLLPAGWGVPQVFRDRLGEDVGRQRLMQAEGHLLLVLHAPPSPEEDCRKGRVFWRNGEGRWKPGSLTHTHHAIGELLDEYEKAADTADAREDDAHTARDQFDVLTLLAPLTRSCHNLHNVLHEARQVAGDDRILLLLRDRAYALTRRLDLLQHDAKTTLDFVIAQRAEDYAASSRRQATASYRLNVLVALFFPVATISTILGANLSNGLEKIDAQAAPIPLLITLGIGLTLGVILAAFVARK